MWPSSAEANKYFYGKALQMRWPLALPSPGFSQAHPGRCKGARSSFKDPVHDVHLDQRIEDELHSEQGSGTCDAGFAR